MTTMKEARSLLSGGNRITKPFLAVGLALGLLVGLLLSLLWGGIRVAGRSIRKGFEPRGADYARAQAVHDVAQDAEAASHQARLTLSAAERVANARARENERRISRRESLRRLPRDQMVQILEWIDARLQGQVGPDLGKLPDGIRASLDRIGGDEAEMRTMQSSLAYALGLDGVRAASAITAADAAATRDLRKRLASNSG